MELQQLIQKFGEQYKGNRYHLLQKNCNHFASDLCFQLVGKTAPSWVRSYSERSVLHQQFGAATALPRYAVDGMLTQTKQGFQGPSNRSMCIR